MYSKKDRRQVAGYLQDSIVDNISSIASKRERSVSFIVSRLILHSWKQLQQKHVTEDELFNTDL